MPTTDKPADTPTVRWAVVAAAQEMQRLGLAPGTSGNVSVRAGDEFLITPPALAYATMAPEDIVAVAPNGPTRGHRRPSSEWQLHGTIYAARAEAGAIVHAHPPFATTLACLEREIPPVHYMVAAAGGASIRCAPYATFGTQALADHVTTALVGRRACLLAHHGLVVFGRDLDAALHLAVDVEALAQQYWQALAIAEPPLLTTAQIAEALAQFSDYRPDP